MSARERRVFLGCPNWRHLGLECHRGLMSLAAALTPTPEGWGIGEILYGGVRWTFRFGYAVHTNIPFAREHLVDEALDCDADSSVHVDADTGFTRDHVLELLECLGDPERWGQTEEDLVVCATKPIALRHPPHNIAAFPFPVTSTCPASWWGEHREVVPVAATGMGLTAFLNAPALELERPLFPVFDNRHGLRSVPIDDLPPWLLTAQAKTVGSDVGFTARLAEHGTVVVDNRPSAQPVGHVVEVTLAPFEVTDIGGHHRGGGPGAGRKTV